MKLRWKLLFGLLLLCFAQTELIAGTEIINSSRTNAVRVNVPSLESYGTGFFLDAEHIVTAFHVVGKINIDKSKMPAEPAEAQISTGSDITIILLTGETISAQIVAPKL